MLSLTNIVIVSTHEDTVGVLQKQGNHSCKISEGNDFKFLLETVFFGQL